MIHVSQLGKDLEGQQPVREDVHHWNSKQLYQHASDQAYYLETR